jgi:high frequency lysogenization protein
LARSLNDRTLALAGVHQAARLVQQVARKGMADGAALASSIRSVLAMDADDVPSVYGGPEGVALGLQVMVRQMGPGPRDMEITRYVVSLLHLERQMRRHSHLADAIREGLEGVMRQARHFEPTHPTIVAALAGVYEQTFSTLAYRIQVRGESGYLTNPDNANRVRALLLAGVRSAVLLRQCGGTVWSVLLVRRRLVAQARSLIEALP